MKTVRKWTKKFRREEWRKQQTKNIIRLFRSEVHSFDDADVCAVLQSPDGVVKCNLCMQRGFYVEIKWKFATNRWMWPVDVAKSLEFNQKTESQEIQMEIMENKNERKRPMPWQWTMIRFWQRNAIKTTILMPSTVTKVENIFTSVVSLRSLDWAECCTWNWADSSMASSATHTHTHTHTASSKARQLFSKMN